MAGRELRASTARLPLPSVPPAPLLVLADSRAEHHHSRSEAARNLEHGDAQWATITGPTQTVVLGVTVGRRVIERGFNGSNGVSVHATGLRFHCTAAFPAGTTTALLASFSAHKMAPPRGWPPPQPSCRPWNCTCVDMADFYGVGADSGAGWGCAPAFAQDWWVHDARPCEQPGYSCCAASDYTKKHAPFPGCQEEERVVGV